MMALACTLVQSACTNEVANINEMQDGTGTFALSLSTGDITENVTTRAVTLPQTASFKLTLKDKLDVALFTDKLYSDLKPLDCSLPSGTGYALSVESCTAEEATLLNNEWGEARFTGEATFDIVSGQTTNVSIACEMQNAGLQVIFDSSFTDEFPIYAMTYQNGRTIAWKNDNPEAVAYFNAVEGQETLAVNMLLTGSKGGWDDRIEKALLIELVPGKIKILTIKYDENSGDLDLDFETDTDVETDDDNNVTIQ